MPSVRPCIAARLMIRRSTYPLPSLDGITPSEIRNVDERIWSVIRRIETSSISSTWYFLPESPQTLSRIAFMVSMSNTESTSCITTARRSSPIPVSMFLCSSSVYPPCPSPLNCVNTLFHTSMKRSQSQPTLQSGLPQPYFSPRS